MNRRKVNLFFILISVLLLFISLVIRAWWGAEQELKLAKEEFAKGNYRWAVIHYEKVILWRFPVGGYTEEAVKILKDLTHHKDQIIRNYAHHALSFSLALQQREQGKVVYLPDSWWSLVLGLSFVGWIGIISLLIFKGFSTELKLRIRAFVPGFMAFIFLFFVWIYSMGRL